MTQPPAMKTSRYVYGVEALDGNDAWALFEACALGTVSTVRSLLKKDRRLVNAQFWYRFPIHMAVFAGHAKIARLLLDHGADPGQSIYTYDSWDKLLQYARQRGHGAIEQMLCRAMRTRFGYDPDFDALKEAIIARDSRRISAVLRRKAHLARASDALGNNALHWCVITRQLALIARFVALGTPIDGQRADGQTPVLLAVNGATDYWYRATRGRTHPSLRNAAVLVGSLLAQGAGYTISVAAAMGDQERVAALLRRDAGLAQRLDPARTSPLAHAAGAGHLHIVRLLLEHGANPNMPESAAPHGAALYEACRGNHFEIARLLLAHGANPNAGVDSCECCLTIAAIYHGRRARPLQELLRQHGAHAPPYRMSVRQLKQAIAQRHEVIRHDEFLGSVILKHNAELLQCYLAADPTVVDRLHLHGGVVFPRSPALVSMLLARGMDPRKPDWLGKTMLHVCAERGDRTLAAMLLKAGAEINARDVEFQGTPLAAAVRACAEAEDPRQARRCLRMVKFLLRRGAATSLPGDAAWATPVAWARKLGLVEIQALLASRSAREARLASRAAPPSTT